jgi:hypothetical protein
LVTADSDASTSGPQALPDGSRVPAQAVRAPASLTPSHGLTLDHTQRVVATATASGIPAVALAAYQFAARVIDTADRSCHLPWQLVAAIGRVESDHGRAQGNVLTDRGLTEPGLYGRPLDGRHGTIEMRDTDAGRYDRDTRYDRAVGPMQFIPSTWAIVGVDADGDGRRDPQDINDAALGVAVYLCSGSDDLATATGQRSAVFRYNHSSAYVDVVLGIERAYLAGDYSAVPNGTTTTGFTWGTPPVVRHAVNRPHATRHHRDHHADHHADHHGDQSPTTTTEDQPTIGPTATPTGEPTANPTSDPSGVEPTRLPTRLPSVLPTSILPTPLPTILGTAEAVVQCLAEGLLQGTSAFDRCVHDLTH